MNALIQKQCVLVCSRKLYSTTVLPSLSQVPVDDHTLSNKKLGSTVHLSHETSLIINLYKALHTTLQKPACVYLIIKFSRAMTYSRQPDPTLARKEAPSVFHTEPGSYLWFLVWLSVESREKKLI